MTSQNYINHITLVLDASTSMGPHRDALVRVADAQVAHLARRSQELDQETRITVYTFADTVSCVIYDKDVLRLPSIEKFYKPHGMTALIDAVLLSQRDLALTPQKYGDHAFLTYVLTDGEENKSKSRPVDLQQCLRGLAEHWTVGVLVPDISGKHEAKKFGFSDIEVWDAKSEAGVMEAGETILRATDTFMTNRATGVRGSRALFMAGSDAVNKKTVATLGLSPLHPSKYHLIHVPSIPEKTWISEFTRTTAGLPYAVGKAYYQLTKPEKIQAGKQIAVVEKGTDKVYVGYEVRKLLGLPDTEIKVQPDVNKEFTIFVQSMSVNRHLVSHTKLLLMV